MPIPKVSGETEQEYISKCIPAIIDEYEQEQAAAICYNTYRTETNMGTQGRIISKMRELAYKGINLAEGDGLEGACWDGYEAIGTKILDGREVPNCVPIKE